MSDGEKNPDKGKDLRYMVPTLQLVWSGTPPTYNEAPANSGGGGGADHRAIVGIVRADLKAMRDTETTMMTDANVAVSEYENVRKYTLAHLDSIWGQTAAGHDAVVQNPNDRGTTWAHVPNDFRETARKFAETMNPAMERGLEQIGGVLEKMGEYMALLNKSGQLFAQADDNSRFPEPPGA